MDDGWMPEFELPLQAWLAFFHNRYGWFLAVCEHVRHAFPCDLLNAVQCLVWCFVQPAEVGEFEYGSYPFLVFVRPFDFVFVAVGGLRWPDPRRRSGLAPPTQRTPNPAATSGCSASRGSRCDPMRVSRQIGKALSVQGEQ